ncbi:hypothetical protein [Bradyrhizobium sp. CCBAU 53338]|uniref:hypothetical protein n=1 Tax=Bradyrhizobium sp. CCBAU 53338 TaxID=1325111 RepID=UPI00188A40C7|nr:hypothetical protein [Bradyrhizobium sp. CCBAU 53338]QOZ51556.1 hypothetical protein XH90_09305 [Bradyrhizobium sp. CCBAU 53338]
MVERASRGTAASDVTMKDAAILLVAVEDTRSPPLISSFAFMLISRARSGACPIHVLVVVVGKHSGPPFQNVQAFCNDIIPFWLDKPHDFTQGMYVRSIQVLASEPAQSISYVDGQTRHDAQEPTFANVAAAFTAWTDRIVKEGGAGILHWMGHGACRMQEGPIQLLFTQAPEDDAPAEGINWHATINDINGLTGGHPMFCFIDSCRTDRDAHHQFSSAFHKAHRPAIRNATVVFSASITQSSFWDNDIHLNDRPAMAKFRGGPLGTRAFLECLAGTGAELFIKGDPFHDVTAAKIAEGAGALFRRWARHLGPSVKKGWNNVADVDAGGMHEPLLRTPKPATVLDVLAGTTGSGCSVKLLPNGPITNGDRGPKGYELHVERGDYEFQVHGKAFKKSIVRAHHEVPVP